MLSVSFDVLMKGSLSGIALLVHVVRVSLLAYQCSYNQTLRFFLYVDEI